MPSVFGPVYLVDLRALPRRARQRAAAMVREIEANPEPDGIFKRPAPAPFKAGTIVASQAGSSFAMQSIATAFVSIACSDSIHEFTVVTKVLTTDSGHGHGGHTG